MWWESDRSLECLILLCLQMECGQLCLAEADCYSIKFEESVLPSLETVCSLGGFHISSDVSTAQLCYVSGELLYLCDVLHLLVSSSIMKFTFWSLSFFVCYDRMVRASIGKALHATYSLLGSWLRGNTVNTCKLSVNVSLGHIWCLH